MKLNKVLVWRIVGGLTLGVAIFMKIQGENNPNLSELQAYWWMPIPFGIISFGIANKLKNQGD